MREQDMTSTRFTSIRCVHETGSTNADLVEQAKLAPDKSAVLFADSQTAGRGRRDRTWTQVPGGGVLVSFYVPCADRDALHAVPTALGIATAEVMGNAANSCLPRLKWPNDIVCEFKGRDRKLAGMLSEVVVVDGAPVGVVAGLGCNIGWPSETQVEIEGDAIGAAIALDTISETPIDRNAFSSALVVGFESELDRLDTLGVDAILDRYRSRCATIGRIVEIQTTDDTVTGRATDLDRDGALLVEIEGRLRRIDVGDVVHLRPELNGD